MLHLLIVQKDALDSVQLTVRFSCGARSAFKLKEKFLEDHTIVPFQSGTELPPEDHSSVDNCYGCQAICQQ